MLLEAVIKFSDQKEDLDYLELVKALEKIREVANFINNRIKDAAFKQKIVDITEETKGIENIDLLFSSRKYIKDGIVGYISKKGLKQRLVYLFTDLILILKITIKGVKEEEDIIRKILENEKSNKKQKIFTLRSAISFDNEPLINVIDIEASNKFKNFFIIATSHKSFCFFFRNEKKKNEWFNEIKGQINTFHTSSNLTEKKKALPMYDFEHSIYSFIPEIKDLKDIQKKEIQKKEKDNKELIAVNKGKRNSIIYQLLKKKEKPEEVKTQKKNFIMEISESEDDEVDNTNELPKGFQEILKNFEKN
jgi:hypothetical protein